MAETAPPPPHISSMPTVLKEPLQRLEMSLINHVTTTDRRFLKVEQAVQDIRDNRSNEIHTLNVNIRAGLFNIAALVIISTITLGCMLLVLSRHR